MRRDPGAWSRQPVVWLGALILAASIVGCVVTVVLAFRYPDPPLDARDGHAINVPLPRSADATPSTQSNR